MKKHLWRAEHIEPVKKHLWRNRELASKYEPEQIQRMLDLSKIQTVPDEHDHETERYRLRGIGGWSENSYSKDSAPFILLGSSRQQHNLSKYTISIL